MNLEFYISPSTDIYYNLALEEFLVRNLNFSNLKLILVYQNDLSVVLGKNQMILNELNYQFYLENQIKVSRRISGGGTVVHDHGNINFAFLESKSMKNVNNYSQSTGLFVDTINHLGVQCYLNDRNAIILENGKKISGSAQFVSATNSISHFTILYHSDLNLINQILAPNPYQIKSKSSPSVRSEVDNLCHYLSLSPSEFIHSSIDYLGFKKEFDPSCIDQKIVEELIQTKYRNLSYIYDTACHGELISSEISLEIDHGKIKNYRSYDGKRLVYEDIDANDSIWNLIFST